MANYYQVLVVILLASLSLGDERRPYFTAAVFENKPAHTEAMTPDEIIESNLKWMEIAADEAANRGADILVFSEYGVYPPDTKVITKRFAEKIPDPQTERINPCISKEKIAESKLLITFSCMAVKHKMYIMANILDLQPGTEDSCDADNVGNCDRDPSHPEDTSLMYNTNIVFDRDGNLISRYHKNHLFFEHLDTPLKPDMTIFETDFGVFATIVCFDSVFGDVVDFIKHHKVDALIFTTYWFDDILPFNAIEWQQAWALTNGVHFLAANAHSPGNGTLGSGIFNKDHGAMSYSYNPDGKSKLLISKVPLDNSTPVEINTKVLIVDDDGIREVEERGVKFPKHCYENSVGPPKDMSRDYRCSKHQTAHYSLKKLEESKGKIKSCNNGFCCYLRYEADTMLEDYFLAAFKGQNDARGYFKWQEETCLLVRCDPFEDSSCVMFPSTAETVFKYVELKAPFKSGSVYPTVSKSHYRLAPKSEWTSKSENEFYVLRFSSKSSVPLLKVGLLGRNYENDPTFIPFTKSGNNLDFLS